MLKPLNALFPLLLFFSGLAIGRAVESGDISTGVILWLLVGIIAFAIQCSFNFWAEAHIPEKP